MKKYETRQKALNHLSILRSYTKVGTINSKIFDKALKSGWTDFEDAMQHFCAIEEKCEAIVTRNLSDFKQSALPVFTPAQFLEANNIA